MLCARAWMKVGLVVWGILCDLKIAVANEGDLVYRCPMCVCVCVCRKYICIVASCEFR